MQERKYKKRFIHSSKSNIKVSVVDIQIDTNTDNNHQNETLEFLHTQERNLFFSLLSEEFINSLGNDL